ncbi:MAG: DNA lyase, partial [Thermoproteota archaeon]|nr:DNA lyase [Thermoproteota archaeon]
MEKVLYHRKLPRLTALTELQMEEECDAFKVLIGTILSARSRDENTKKVLNNLFVRFKNAKELAEADIQEIKAIIHSSGFYNVKAKRI